MKADILIIFPELTLTGIGLLVNIVNAKICLTKKDFDRNSTYLDLQNFKEKNTLLQILLLLSQINAF